jgi:hypothetical protein
LRADTATRAPRSIRARANAAPMPLLAPITQTRIPVHFLIGSLKDMSRPFCSKTWSDHEERLRNDRVTSPSRNPNLLISETLIITSSSIRYIQSSKSTL